VITTQPMTAMMFSVAAPDLASLVLGQATVLSMRGLEFSQDGRYLLVETTFSDDSNPGAQRKAVSLYDCVQQTHLRVYNGLLGAAEAIDIHSAALAVVGGQARVALAFSVQGVDQGSATRVAWVIDGSVQSTDLIEQISGERANAAVESLALTQDGQFLALATAANNLLSSLAPGLDTNEVTDVYGLNLQSQTLERLSTLQDGTESTEPSRLGDVRQLTDGRIVVSFANAGSELANLDANGLDDVLLWSRVAGQVSSSLELLSRNAQGRSASGASTASVISDAGVLFQSFASDLVAGDTNATQDLFLKAWAGPPLSRVTEQTLQDGGRLQYDSDVILGGSSADGRWLVWMTDASAAGAEPGISQVFLQDRNLGTVVAVSAATQSTGTATPSIVLGDESSFFPLISESGGQIAFSTLAMNLSAGDIGPSSPVQLLVAVNPHVNDPPVGQVSITGVAERGQTLTATNNLTDLDGIPTEGAGKPAYQWKADGATIESATSATLVLGQAQVGQVITVQVSYIDGFGTAERVTSEPTAAVTGLIEGQVYHWKSHALLGGVAVQSKLGDTSINAAGATQADGAYRLSGIPAQSVTVQATRQATDSGNAVSAADALAALRIAVGLNPNLDPDGAGPLLAPKISPYQIIAADMNEDGRVTAADALAILRMSVKLSSAPPQKWLFVEDRRDFWDDLGAGVVPKLTRTTASWDSTIAASPSEQSLNLVGILKGDVNGNWSAPTGSIDLDIVDPGYFAALASSIGAPIDQWGL